MPFPRPQFDQYPWDGPLVNHMAQLMDPAIGGINYWSARPTLGVDGAPLSMSHIGFTGYNSTTETFERWDGTTWCELGSGGSIPVWTTATRPTAPEANDLGFNTTLNSFEIFNGTNWIPISSLSPIPQWGDNSRPTNPKTGDFGFNTERNSLEMWDGVEWESISGALPLLPEETPETGDQYFDTVNRVPRVWDSSKWMPTAPIISPTAPVNVPDNSMWLDTAFEPPILKLKTPEGWETISNEGAPIIDPSFDWDTVTPTVANATLGTTTPQYIMVGPGNPTITLPATPPAGMTVYLNSTDPANTASIAFNGKTYGGSGDRRRYSGGLGVVKMEFIEGVWTSTPLMPLLPTNGSITNPILSSYFGGSNTAHINYVVDNMVSEGLWSKFNSATGTFFYDFRPAELVQDKVFNWVDPSRYKLLGSGASYNGNGMSISNISSSSGFNFSTSGLFDLGAEKCLVVKNGQSGQVYFTPRNITIYTPGKNAAGYAGASIGLKVGRLHWGNIATEFAAYPNGQGYAWGRWGFFVNSTINDLNGPITITDSQVPNPGIFQPWGAEWTACSPSWGGNPNTCPQAQFQAATFFINNSGGYLSVYRALEGSPTVSLYFNAIATPSVFEGLSTFLSELYNIKSLAMCSSFTSLSQMSTYAQILDNAPLAS